MHLTFAYLTTANGLLTPWIKSGIFIVIWLFVGTSSQAQTIAINYSEFISNSNSSVSSTEKHRLIELKGESVSHIDGRKESITVYGKNPLVTYAKISNLGKLQDLDALTQTVELLTIHVTGALARPIDFQNFSEWNQLKYIHFIFDTEPSAAWTQWIQQMPNSVRLIYSIEPAK